MCERSLRHVIKTDAKPFDDVVKDLFHLFAGSEPGVQHVDFMEVQMALLFCATHSFEAKANFIFDCMDFEGTDWVTQPAFEITFKSIEAGLRKISVDPNVDPGKLTKERTGQNAELNIQNMASSWFDQCRNMRDGMAVARRTVTHTTAAADVAAAHRPLPPLFSLTPTPSPTPRLTNALF